MPSLSNLSQLLNKLMISLSLLLAHVFLVSIVGLPLILNTPSLLAEYGNDILLHPSNVNYLLLNVKLNGLNNLSKA